MTALLPARAPTPSGPARYASIRWVVSLAIAAALILSACGEGVVELAAAESADDGDVARQSDVRDAVRAAPQASPDSAPLEFVATQEGEPLPSVHERAWVDWVRSTAAGTGWWHGGDGNGSIELPDGRVWHFFSDTYNGLVDEDFSRGSGGLHLTTNSIVIRDGDGGFVGQVWEERIAASPPSHAPAVVPDPERYPDNFYWFPGGVVLEDGQLRVLAGLMQRDPFQRVDTHILTIDTDTGAVTDVVATGVTALDFNPSGLFEHRGWFYMHGQRPKVTVQDGWGMARAPVGSLRDTDTWQAWDGQDWNDDLAAHVGIEATDGELLPTYGVYYDFRPFPHGFLALGVPLDGGLNVYAAQSPAGPYHLIATLETDTDEGEDTNGGVLAAYAPRWHPHYDTDQGMVVSYATNYFVKPDIPDTDFDNAYYMPHYLTIPQELVEGLVTG